LASGCAWYQPELLVPRDTSITADALARVHIDPSTMPLQQLAMHRFDPSKGLDIEQVAMLAVVTNPDLKLARDDLGVARAQAFSAGLLPDPQLGISSDFPGAVGFSRAFNYGLSMDVMSIVTRGANRKSAQATAAKTDLGLLWQEWQVIVQAKQLFLKVRLADETLPLLQQLRDLSRDRYERMAAAQRQGNLTSDTLAAALISYGDARKQYFDAQRAALQSRHDLNALLGLASDVRLQLADDGEITPLSDASIDAAVMQLPKRRPDLLGLEAGYQAQEQKYRAAILSQFPSLSVGFSRSRDTSEIYSTGFQINLSLPIFNRNRGNIAIEKATRQRLLDEYQTRLNEVDSEVARLRTDGGILARQLKETEGALPDVDLSARRAAQAYQERNISLDAYTDAQTAALTKRIDIVTLKESLAEQRIGLQALLGSAIPDAFSSDLTFTETYAK
jgi:outer membrane protein TolC